MIRYDDLVKRPEVAPRLIGMELSAFDSLFERFEKDYASYLSPRRIARRDPKKRRRRPGAGRRSQHSLRERLIMTLFWVHARPTHVVLGQMYGLHRCSVEKILADIVCGLQRISGFEIENIPQERATLRTLRATMELFPEIRVLSNSQIQFVDEEEPMRSPP